MQNNTYKVQRFILASDLTELRNNAIYQQMRAEINRRNNPLSGGTDWEKVHQLAEQLICSVGADLLTSAYYISAACKTQGVSGLASGLELMLSIVSYSAELVQLPCEKVAETINWAVTKITPELKQMAATPANVREWYRCEYACQQLFELLKQKQPQHVPNLDVLGYLIFEKIDLIDSNKSKGLNSTITPRTDSPPQVNKSTKWPVLMMLSTLLMCSVLSSYLSVIYHEKIIAKAPSWLYQAPEVVVVPPLSVAQLIDKLFNLPLQEPLISVYPEQVMLLVDLDKHYRRFSVARTKMANLSQLAVQLPKNRRKVQGLSSDLAEYASSLTPILGRAYYIDDLLADQELGRAKFELTQLNNQLKALLIKRTLLTQAWNKQHKAVVLSGDNVSVTGNKKKVLFDVAADTSHSIPSIVKQ
ncbi:type VI secretion system ImpA family N-terminal domain-containing protein [Shewanella sp. VB17]|uniref:type VI secretion system ImpA family N-terminal domain-containing protein n=1 Tax=Shewanella sp. VB17 TaxID=2739432 RepID=UPI001563F83F|nr:type VI secretion system ImpA family N-terminal domain-containing protein [Shewanella sp. VB17]NRD73750.1 type VI secretion system ImpA family N-terminal domain-containing protein [Shewanella sp. VB17]